MGRKSNKALITTERSSTLGTQMRLARQSKSLTLSQLAKQVNYTKGYLSGIENDKIWPPQALVQKYEEVLDVPGKLLKLWEASLSETSSQKIPQISATTLLALMEIEGKQARSNVQKQLVKLLDDENCADDIQAFLRWLAFSCTATNQSFVTNIFSLAYAHHSAMIQHIFNDLFATPNLVIPLQIALLIGSQHRSEEILVMGICHKRLEIRARAIQYMYFYHPFEQDIEASLKILKKCVLRIDINDFAHTAYSADGALALTLIIACAAFAQKEQADVYQTLRAIRAIWQPLIDTIRTIINDRDRDKGEFVRLGAWFVMEYPEAWRMISRMMQRDLDVIHHAQQLLISEHDYQASFPLDSKQKQLCSEILTYYITPGDVERLREICGDVQSMRNLVIVHITFGALVATYVRDPIALLPLIQHLFARAKELNENQHKHYAPMLTPFLIMVFQNTPWVKLTDEDKQKVLDMYGHMVQEYEIFFDGLMLSSKDNRYHYWSDLAEYSYCMQRYYPSTASDPKPFMAIGVLSVVIQHLIETGNFTAISFHIHRYTRLAWSSVWSSPEDAMAGLIAIRQQLIDKHVLNVQLKQDINKNIALCMSAKPEEVYYLGYDIPDEVEDLASDLHLPITMGDVLGNVLINFFKIGFGWEDDSIRHLVQAMLAKAIEFPTLQESLIELAKELIALFLPS